MIDDIKLIDAERAIASLQDGDEIHTFMQAGQVMIGADWNRADVESLLRSASEIHVTGPNAQAMKHGLAVLEPITRDWLYISTRERTDDGGVA